MFKYRWMERYLNRVTLLIGQLGRAVYVKLARQRSRVNAGDKDLGNDADEHQSSFIGYE